MRMNIVFHYFTRYRLCVINSKFELIENCKINFQFSMGRRDKAYDAYNQCKKYLGKIYDDLESFSVVCTYNYMSFFLAGEGEDELSKNYLSVVDHYFQRRKKKQAQGLSCFDNSEHFIVNNLDKKRGVTRIFYYDNRLEWTPYQKYSELVGVAYKISTGEDLPQRFVDILDSDLNENTYQIQMDVLDEMHKLMKKSHKARSHVPEYVQIGLVTDKLNVALHRLEALRVVLSKNPVNRKSVKLYMLKQADDISEIVDNIYFGGMLPMFIFGFAVAAQVHFEFFFDEEVIGGQVTREHILNSLRRDLKGLKMFAAKFGRTTKVYGHIMSAIEALILNVSPQNPNNPVEVAPDKPSVDAPDTVSTYTSTFVGGSTTSPPSSYGTPSSDTNTTKRRDLPSAQFLANTMKNFIHSKKNTVQ